jgi:hypothetical protein
MLHKLPIYILDIIFNEVQCCERIEKEMKCKKSKFNFVMKELTSIKNEMNEDLSFFRPHKIILWQAKQNCYDNMRERDENMILFDNCLYEMLTN